MSGPPKHAPKPDQLEYYDPGQLVQLDYRKTPAMCTSFENGKYARSALTRKRCA